MANMNTARAFVVTHKATGRRVVGEVKLSWNRKYYSFDRETWHASKLAAYQQAEATGLLWDAK